MPDDGEVTSVVSPGEIIAGKFRVERILGEGGMGIVVAATHLQLREPVALKFLRSEVKENAQVVARFAHEARAAAKLKSEHVARVLDVGAREDGTPYMVMEHLQGKDMGMLIEHQPRLPIAQAVEYTIQACEGLAEAHARGIVHRDIKPENLFLVERDGWQCVKILDFGISKAALTAAATPEEVAVLETNAIMGSPCYMSPEQLRSSEVDHRADLWSLGAVLFELVAGKTAFDSDQPLSDLISDILEREPRSLADMREDVPLELDAVVRRCLTKDRDQRFQSAAELAVALLPFAPRRARVVAERAVTVTRTAGLGDASLNLPPSVFPSAPPMSAGGARGPSSVPGSFATPRVPRFSSAPTAGPSSSRGGTSLPGMQLGSAPPAPSPGRPAVSLAIAALVALAAVGAAAIVQRAISRGHAASPEAAVVAAAAAAPATAPTTETLEPSAAAASAGARNGEASRVAQVRVETTPGGAVVDENGVELCASTPCVVTYQGAEAAASAPHTLSIAKPGFRPETRVVHASDPALHVKLAKATAAPAKSAHPAAAPTVEGFKDLPY